MPQTPRYRSHGRQARRQGEKLAYANFVIDLSTPVRKFNLLPRAMFDTAIQRDPFLVDVFRPTLSNVIRNAIRP